MADNPSNSDSPASQDEEGGDRKPGSSGSSGGSGGSGGSGQADRGDSNDAGEKSDRLGPDPSEFSADSLSDELAKKYDPERLLQAVSKRAGKGERLAHHQQVKYERLIGGHFGKVNFDKVRIYTGEFAEEFTKKHNAHAVTIGNTGMVLMGRSPTRSMATYAGEALLAHELTHVAQAQKGLWAADKEGGTTNQEKEKVEGPAHRMEELAKQLPGDRAAQSQKRAQLIKAAEAKILERVLELYGESMLVSGFRSGPARRRP